MDYSKFLDDSFEPKDWINAAFRANKGTGAANDQYATTLVMKLQLLVQEVNSVIEETSREVVSNLPRVLRDVETIKQEAALLQDQMKHIKQDVQKVEQDTSKSMQALLQLDTIKSRMEQTAEALQQADQWTVLSSEIEDVIQSGDADLLTAKLIAMQQSLRLLASVPDYDDRCQHLEALKNRLESLVSPNIITGLTSGSQESTRHYVEMFTSIHRFEQMQRYYEHFHKSLLSKSWAEHTQVPDKTLPQSLALFYDTVMSTFHSQMSWCAGVFDEPISIVCQMLAVSLESLEKEISSSIVQHVDNQDNCLQFVMQLKQVTDRFAQTLEMALLDRLQSQENYSACVMPLARVVYEPYLPFFRDYSKLESQSILSELDKVEMEDRRYIDTSISKLSASVSQVFKVSRGVIDRCSLLTGGVGYLAIADIYNSFFSNYATEVKRILVNLGEKFRSQPEGQADLDSWTMFSYALQTIQISGEIIAEIEELDETVVGDILLTTDKLSVQAATPLSDIRVIYQLSSEQILLLEQLRETASEKQSVLPVSLKVLRSLSEHAHKLAFESVFSQIDKHLHGLSESEVWMSESAGGALTTDLPTFSLSPQEYITQIGQYIMTLPQYLDPFTTETNAGDNSEALSITLAVKYGRLPYSKLEKDVEHLDSIWLESVSRATMHTYCDEILRISEITPHATKQLIVDIDYFKNVLDDIGLDPIDQLVSISELLKASPQLYANASQNIPKPLSTTIRTMRRIEN
ncbi:conserved oligomeric Golgi complex subunit 7-like [Watersipora subatra]|uniref:conserved oligomeric Golgi complex subunit 7-like n=1 Tax=Watersipora subatra TaxID=2589382 RepID=UPI00355C297D